MASSFCLKEARNVLSGLKNPLGSRHKEKEVKVEANWSDFVFYDNYKFRSFEEVEEHIAEKGHLPEIPSESEVTENGINLGEMDAKLLQKIEELTLYMIDVNKRVKELESENQELKEEISTHKQIKDHNISYEIMQGYEKRNSIPF